MLTKKIFTILLICLSLSAPDAFARKVSLKKIGGNNTLFVPTGYTLANLPNATITTDLIIWDDDLSSGNPMISNWTDIFVDVSYIINNDLQNSSLNVEYQIMIDAPQSNPIMVGKQNTLSVTKFADGKNIIDLENPTSRINKVTVSTLNSKAYVKYEPNLFYGSWLKNGQSFTFYTFEHDDDENFVTPGTTIINSTIYPSTSTFYKLAFVINGTSGITTTPYTNSSGFDKAVSAIQGTPTGSVWRQVYGEALKADIGYFFAATNCNDVTVEKIDLDGNNINAQLGGVYGDGGMQLVHTGIYYADCEYSNIKDVNIHNMCLDGAYVRGNLTNNITIDNSFFEFNVRQGLSWLEGTNLMANYCSFSNTGRAISIASGINIGSPPASGLDIEPGAGHEVHNGTFNHCNFDNNVGNCVANDGAELTTFDMTFNHCTFSDIDGYGLLCTGDNFTFDDCDIDCAVINGYSGSSPNGYHKYINCRFEDKPYNGAHWTNDHKLVHIDGSKKTLFQQCIFKVNDSLREFMYLNSAFPDRNDWSVIDSCKFTYNNLGYYTISSLAGIRFKRKNKVENILNGINAYHIFSTPHAMIDGGDNSCDPNRLEFEGQVEHVMPASGTDTFYIGRKIDGTDGWAQYVIKDKSLLDIQDSMTVDIGKNSSLHIEDGGSIVGATSASQATHIVDNGQLIAHANSFVSLGYDSIYNNVNTVNTLLYLDKTCNANNTTTSPVWCNGLGFGTGNYININNTIWVPHLATGSTLCWQGGNSNLTSGTCSTIYTNIASENSISVLYNKSVSCFGDDSAGFNFKVIGGTPSYIDSLDGALVTGTTNLTIATGNHTLKVKDATGCTESFVINIDTAFKYMIIKGCVGTSSPGKFSTNACSTIVVTNPLGSSVTPISNVYTATMAGTYHITATSGSGATFTTTLYIGSCDSCSGLAVTTDSNAQWYAPNSTISSIFANGVAPSTAIVLSGNLIVDTTLYIYNNNGVYMTANSELVVDSNQRVVINTSKLHGCNAYWKGITADGVNRTVIVNHYSTLKDMKEGVQIKNNAFLQARDSWFLNNATTSIRFLNMNDPNYNGIVWDNVFESDSTFITYSGATKGQTGVSLFNCDHIDIGDKSDLAHFNAFKNLYTGAYINGLSNIDSVLPLGNHLGLYNNTFENIHGDTWQDIVTTAYTNSKGAGVYIDYSTTPSFKANTTVSYTGSGIVDSARFKYCDKAIVSQNNNLIDSLLYIKNCLLGIMNLNYFKRTCIISKNKIDSAYIGIQLLGEYKSCDIRNNNIISVLSPCNSYPPMGIDMNKYSSVLDTMAYLNISGNTININSYIGKGIRTMNGTASLYIGNNKVQFTTTDSNRYRCGVGIDFALYGVFCSHSNGIRLEKNRVDGIHDSSVYAIQYSRGMYFEYSPNCKINCNQIRYTKQGFYVWGNNSTDSSAIHDNKFKFNLNPLYTLDNGSSQAGTFGQIGDGVNDNGNDWLYNTANKSWLQNQSFKVWRNSNTPIGDQIITSSSLLVQTESGSSNFNLYQYLPLNPIGMSYADTLCPDSTFMTVNNDDDYTNTPIHWTRIDEDNAAAVAMDSINYIDFAEVGHWLDNLRLYTTLESDSVLRNSSSILNNFYNTYESTTIGNINKADLAMSVLFNFKGNADEMTQQYNIALDDIHKVVSDEDYETYEMAMNLIALNMARYGIDSISTTQRMELEILANTCPYVGGDAVYKARALWAMFQPNAQYNDRLMCLQSSGENKNGSSGNVNLDSLYEAQTNEAANALVQKIKANNIIKSKLGDDNLYSLISVYPNPANDQITIGYQSTVNGVFKLYNSFGELVKTSILLKNVNKIQLQLNDLASGLYHYKIQFANTNNYIGKLTILK